MKIELPFPSAKLFPNRSKGHHFGASYTARVIEKNAATLIGKSWRNKSGFIPCKNATYGLYVLFKPNLDNKDLDNCLSALKPALDGLAIALGVNDKQFRPITIDCRSVGKKVRQSVEILIEESSS